MPASPLLLLVPYRYKAAVLYSQIPISASASGDFVVSRAGNTASRILGNGNIETGVLANIARINYPRTGVASGCAGLLVEPSAQNLALQSENFTTTWAQTALNITSGFTSPSNNNSGTLIEATANTGRMRQTFASLTSGVTSTFSLFAKLGTQSSGVTLVFQEGNSTNYSSGVCQSFRLDTGAVGTSGTLGAGFTFIRSGIENYGNGWYRCSLTVQLSYTPSSANLTIRPTSTVTANLPSTSSGDTSYIFGAQLETGSVATSYIPTTTAAVTRNSDVITNNQFVIPNLIGAILTEFESPTSGTYFVDNLPVTLVSGYNKVAISYTPTTITVYRNGTQVSGSPFSPPGGVLPILGNVINIGHNNQYYQLGANIRSFVLYSSTLTAAEASGLTT
jgi:hypothetical protein